VAPVSAGWATIAGLAVTTALLKTSGPVFLGGRTLPHVVSVTIVLLAPALLAGLVMTETFADGSALSLDARAAGLTAAALAIQRRASLVATILIAALVTAGVRAVT
jgi:hypothetical protein